MSTDPTSASPVSRFLRPLRRLTARIVRAGIAHCPRGLRDHFDAHRSRYVSLLPERIKEFLKSTVLRAAPDEALRRRLDDFISREAEANPWGQLFLIFSSVPFDESQGQRSTRLARELARRGIPVIFAYWRWKSYEPVKSSNLPGVFCLPIDEFQATYESLLADARLNSLRRVLLIEFPHPCLFEIVNYANVCDWRTVHDVIDDWEEFHKRGQAVWYDRDFETYLLQNTDLATATHNNLLGKIQALGAERTALLPNAFEDWPQGDCTDFLANENRTVPFGSNKRKTGITIGYFGHLTSSWFDWPLVVSLANRRPDWTFEIIGYGLDKRIARPENLVFLGPVDHHLLPTRARNWDVAMIPFQASKLSAAVDPIKVYEYISLSLPVVASGMPHLASYPGVFTAETETQFETALEKAAATKIDRATTVAFLAQNGWSNRVDSLLEMLDQEENWNAVSAALVKDGRPYTAETVVVNDP